MRLILQRLSDDGDSTIGALYVDGALAAFTLEDQHRDVKVRGDTRIPAGTYRITLQSAGSLHVQYARKFSRFHKGMLHLEGVPGFEGIMIHVGNDDGDTAGCILVGDQAVSNQQGSAGNEGRVLASTACYSRIYPVVAAVIEAGLVVEIEVRDESAIAGVGKTESSMTTPDGRVVS